MNQFGALSFFIQVVQENDDNKTKYLIENMILIYVNIKGN